MVADLGEVENGERLGRLPRGDEERTDAALEVGDPVLHDLVGRVADAGVDRAELGQREARGRLCGIVEDIGRGLVDRQGAGTGRGVRGLAGVDLAGLEGPVGGHAVCSWILVCGCGRPHPVGSSVRLMTKIGHRRPRAPSRRSGGRSDYPGGPRRTDSTHSTMATHAGSPARTRGPGGPALAGRVRGPPGHHPGHPTARGGLPPSKPGLVAGTHDLASRVTSSRNLPEAWRIRVGDPFLRFERGPPRRP